MSKVIDRIFVQSGLAKLFPPRLDEMKFSAPSEGSEEERLAQRPAAGAWYAWWVDRNGDDEVALNTVKGQISLESCIAFRAGWKQATDVAEK